MKEDLIKLQQMLSRVPPWVAVAAVLATAIIGYYAVLGARYWDVSKESPSLTSQIQELMRGARGEVTEEKEVRAELESLKLHLEKLRALFDYPETDDLMEIMVDTAAEIPVTLRSITIGDINSDSLNDIRFQVQPMNVTVQGEPDSIYGFLSRLQEKIPVIGVTAARFSDIDAKPIGQIDFVVYLSPEVELEEDEAG